VIDYLVGGIRISLGADSNTPGPRTHIRRFVAAARESGYPTRLLLASEYPFMGRFSAVTHSGYQNLSTAKIVAVDAVRLVIMVWCGVVTFIRTSRLPAPDIIYERSAVFQSLSSFHRHKKRAVRVVEANGVFSRETGRDRNISKAEWLTGAIERHVLRRADLVVAISEALADELSSFARIDREQILVVPNGVDPSLTSVERVPSSTFTFGFVGAVVEWHDLPDIVSTICGALCETNTTVDGRPVAVEIIGDGPALDELQTRVAVAGWGRHVRFRGKVTQDEAVRAMAGWSVGIASHRASSSSAMYHSPLKLYEYAGLGLAIVCTPSEDARRLADSGANVHVFDGVDDLRRVLETPEVFVRPADEIEASRFAVASDHSWTRRVRDVVAATRGGA